MNPTKEEIEWAYRYITTGEGLLQPGMFARSANILAAAYREAIKEIKRLNHEL